MEATKVRDLDKGPTGASRSLWRLTPPYEVRDCEGKVEQTTEHVIVSAVDAMFTGAETYIFPADADGTVTNWGELPGSYRGGYDHQQAIDCLVASASASV